MHLINILPGVKIIFKYYKYWSFKPKTGFSAHCSKPAWFYLSRCPVCEASASCCCHCSSGSVCACPRPAGPVDPRTRLWPRFSNFHNWLNGERSGGRCKEAQKTTRSKAEQLPRGGRVRRMWTKTFSVATPPSSS